jgi:hypothetical protein
LGYRSEPIRTISTCAPLTQPYSTSSDPSAELETVSSDKNAPRHVVSRSLLELVKNHHVASASAGLLQERLPEILRTAAELLETDVELSTDMWLPVLRVAGIIFRFTEILTRQIENSNATVSFRQRFYLGFFRVISLICNNLSEDCPTPLKKMRFLECLMEVTNDLLDPLSIAGVTEFNQPTTANTLKLWLDTIRSELYAMRSLLPEDTPVFTCPFPLAGCTYQTTNMQHWILHKDKCCEQRSASRTARPFENEANERFDSRWVLCEVARRKYKIGNTSAVFWRDIPTIAISSRPALRARAREIAGSYVTGGLGACSTAASTRSLGAWSTAISASGCCTSCHHPHCPPQCDHRPLCEAIYRIVWLELLRLFGLCMLSVMPLCTNMLGFVVCWLTILRSVSMWKREGRLLLLV